MHLVRRAVAFATVTVCLGLSACGDDPAQPLAPSSTASSLGTAAPKSQAAKKFSPSKSDSTVTFIMDAVDEKIRGKVTNAVGGALFVDPKDLSKTTGTISVDVSSLELFQQKRGAEGFGEEIKDDNQNKHARAWLEIDDTAPADQRAKNQNVEFKIESIESVSEKDLTKIKGAERKVTAKAKGTFLLHQRESKKTADLDITFTMDGENITKVAIKSAKPFGVGLAEHDVRPRDAFGKFAAKTLDDLGSKVAKEAMVDLDLVFVAGEAPPASSAAPTPSDSAPTPEASASAAPATSGSAAASAAPAASVAPASSAKKPSGY